MAFWNWLSGPHYHWLIFCVCVLAVGCAVRMAIHGFDPGEGNDDAGGEGS